MQQGVNWGVRAGLDEAGLGPLLGPLCIGWSAIAVEGAASDLWEVLDEAVLRSPKRGDERLVVADSKRVHDGTARGRARLESTALAFARAAGHDVSTARALWETPPPHLRPTAEEIAAHPWYTCERTWPAHQEATVLEAQTALLRATSRADVREACVRVVPEASLNESWDRLDNKASAVWELVRGAIHDLFDRFGAEGLHLVLDRQGGRRRYGALLAAEFPFAEVRTLREDREECIVEVRRGSERMRIEVRPRAESSSLPVAVASCLAKQAREAAMEAFNRWFGEFDPGLRPTAGYVQDGRRWLTEAAPALERAGVERGRLVRTR